MEHIKLQLRTWFITIYLICPAKTGLFTLILKRQLGISYPTTWPMHQKLNSATAQLDNALQLSGFVPAYLGGERESGKMGRGAENKFPSAAAVAVDFLRLPLCLKLNLVSGFTREASRKWAKAHLRTQTTVISDGLGCSAAVAGNGCMHLPMAVGERRPRDLRQLKWANSAWQPKSELWLVLSVP